MRFKRKELRITHHALRTMPTPINHKHLAWSLAALAFALMAATAWLVWLGRASPWRAEGDQTVAFQLVGLAGNLVSPLVGALIALRQPRSAYGWLWLATSVGFGLVVFTIAYAFQGLLVAPGSLPLAAPAHALAGLAWVLNTATAPFILLLFPTGRLPSARWRWAGWAAAGAAVLAAATAWALPGESSFIRGLQNPYGLEGPTGGVVEALANISVILIYFVILAGVVSLVARFRRAAGAERQQLKWFTYGAVLIGAALVSDFFYTAPGVWEAVKEAVLFNMLSPVTIGVAILYHRLYDIDFLIRRTLVYSLLTGALGLIYFGIVAGMQGLIAVAAPVASLPGSASSGTPVAIVISTLVIAALFSPLRRGVQRIIDRRFYRRRYDAARTLAQFAAAARDEVELESLSRRLVQTVDETMQPASLSLWIPGEGVRVTKPRHL
jgi:hypothetical protein